MRPFLILAASVVLVACGIENSDIAEESSDAAIVSVDASADAGVETGDGGGCWYVPDYTAEKPACAHGQDEEPRCCAQIGDSGVGHCCFGDDAGV